MSATIVVCLTCTTYQSLTHTLPSSFPPSFPPTLLPPLLPPLLCLSHPHPLTPSPPTDLDQLNWIKWRTGMILQYGNLTILTIEELDGGLFPTAKNLEGIKICTQDNWVLHKYVN